MNLTVWLSGENLLLARGELEGAARRLGGRPVPTAPGAGTSNRAVVDMPSQESGRELTARLALAHRSAEQWPQTALEPITTRLRSTGASGASAAFQWVPGTVGPRPPDLLRGLGSAFRDGGGRIDLRAPDRRFWVEPDLYGGITFFEEVGRVDRAAYSRRTPPHLPYRRPVTLPPRFARALVNLSEVGPGDRVIDPFVGTGSLLIESALVGARTVGVDVGAEMIRGALRNFSHFGMTPEQLRQADAASAASDFPESSFDALVTDPPYGRASGTRGEPPRRLWGRALEAWSRRVRPGGHIGVAVPLGADLPSLPARLLVSVPQRVHRSLTREFRVYVRTADGE